MVGGETAELPGLYADGHFDLAGFAVGAVEREALLPNYDELEAGDLLIGLGSSGMHSNGYSLIRRLIDDLGLNLDAPAPFDEEQSLRQALLAPTRLYGEAVHAALNAVPGAVRALCHVTGGGLPGNLNRVLREDLQALVNPVCWTPVPLFGWLQSLNRVEVSELYRTFNMGVGMVLVVRADDFGAIMAALAGQAAVFRIGEVRSRPSAAASQVQISGVSG